MKRISFIKLFRGVEEKYCLDISSHHHFSLSQVWAKGGEGAIDLANQVFELWE